MRKITKLSTLLVVVLLLTFPSLALVAEAQLTGKRVGVWLASSQTGPSAEWFVNNYFYPDNPSYIRFTTAQLFARAYYQPDVTRTVDIVSLVDSDPNIKISVIFSWDLAVESQWTQVANALDSLVGHPSLSWVGISGEHSTFNGPTGVPSSDIESSSLGRSWNNATLSQQQIEALYDRFNSMATARGFQILHYYITFGEINWRNTGEEKSEVISWPAWPENLAGNYQYKISDLDLGTTANIHGISAGLSTSAFNAWTQTAIDIFIQKASEKSDDNRHLVLFETGAYEGIDDWARPEFRDALAKALDTYTPNVWIKPQSNINNNQSPTVTATSTPSSGQAPLAVNFTSQGTDPDGTIVSYSWNFGDGIGSSNLQNPVYTYTNSGTYTATLTVTDNSGAIGQDTLTIIVSETPPPIDSEFPVVTQRRSTDPDTYLSLNDPYIHGTTEGVLWIDVNPWPPKTGDIIEVSAEIAGTGIDSVILRWALEPVGFAISRTELQNNGYNPTWYEKNMVLNGAVYTAELGPFNTQTLVACSVIVNYSSGREKADLYNFFAVEDRNRTYQEFAFNKYAIAPIEAGPAIGYPWDGWQNVKAVHGGLNVLPGGNARAVYGPTTVAVIRFINGLAWAGSMMDKMPRLETSLGATGGINNNHPASTFLWLASSDYYTVHSKMRRASQDPYCFPRIGFGPEANGMYRSSEDYSRFTFDWFRMETGLSIPSTLISNYDNQTFYNWLSADSSRMQNWILWHRERGGEWLKNFDQFLTSYNPNWFGDYMDYGGNILISHAYSQRTMNSLFSHYTVYGGQDIIKLFNGDLFTLEAGGGRGDGDPKTVCITPDVAANEVLIALRSNTRIVNHPFTGYLNTGEENTYIPEKADKTDYFMQKLDQIDKYSKLKGAGLPLVRVGCLIDYNNNRMVQSAARAGYLITSFASREPVFTWMVNSVADLQKYDVLLWPRYGSSIYTNQFLDIIEAYIRQGGGLVVLDRNTQTTQLDNRLGNTGRFTLGQGRVISNSSNVDNSEEWMNDILWCAKKEKFMNWFIALEGHDTRTPSPYYRPDGVTWTPAPAEAVDMGAWFKVCQENPGEAYIWFINARRAERIMNARLNLDAFGILPGDNVDVSNETTKDAYSNFSREGNFLTLSTTVPAKDFTVLKIKTTTEPAPTPDTAPPTSITDLSISTGLNQGEIDLTWTSPGDDGNIGTSAIYIIKYSTSNIANNSEFDLATDVTGEPAPAISGTPQSMTVSGLTPGETYYFNIKTQDEVSNTSDLSNTVSAVAGQPPLSNQQPILSPIGDQSVDENTLLTFTVTATDADGDTLSYSAANIPTAASFNTSTGVFSFTPTYEQAGTYPLTFNVSDGKSGTDSEIITITVNDVPILNQPPVATANANPTSGVAPLTVNFTSQGTDPDGTIVSYSWNFGDGVGNSTLQNPTYTYNNAGSYTAQVTVTDNGGATASTSLNINVYTQNLPPGKHFGFWEGWPEGRGYSPSEFFNAYFLTPPYPSFLEVILTNWSSWSSDSVQNWYDQMLTLADQYLNIEVAFMLGAPTTETTMDDPNHPLWKDFEDFIVRLKGHRSAFSFGIMWEYFEPNTWQTAMNAYNITQRRGVRFVSYRSAYETMEGNQQVEGIWDIPHSNFPEGGQMSTLDRGVGFFNIGMSAGYARQHSDFPSTTPCPSDRAAAIDYGWQKCTVDEIINNAVTKNDKLRHAVTFLPESTTFTFTGVSGKTTNRLWDNPQFRQWVWENPNYRPNFVFSLTPINISGRLKDINLNPITANVISSTASILNIRYADTTDGEGNYNLSVPPAIHDIEYDILNFFIPNYWLKLSSINLSSDIVDPITQITGDQANNKISLTFNLTGQQTIQSYSPAKPGRILKNALPLTEYLSLNELNSASDGWYYDDINKLVYVRYSE